MAETKTRYSDAELAEFKAIIEEKLAKAKAEYNTLRHIVMHNEMHVAVDGELDLAVL